MGLRQEGEILVLKGGGEKVIGGTLLGLMTLLALVPTLSSRGGIAIRIVGATILLTSGTLWLRFLRTEIRAGPDGLILRTPFRTHRVGWHDVTGAAVVPTNGNRIFGIVRVTLRDGRSVKVDGVGNRWHRAGMDTSPVGQMAAAINQRAAGP